MYLSFSISLFSIYFFIFIFVLLTVNLITEFVSGELTSICMDDKIRRHQLQFGMPPNTKLIV